MSKINRFEPDENYCRSYATIANLDKALEKLNFSDLIHTIYRFESGRVTALFIDKRANSVIFERFPWCI